MKLITDKNLQFKDPKTEGALGKFYSDEENTLRNRHTYEYHRSSMLFKTIEPRIDAITQLLSPYASIYESTKTPEYMPDLKSSLASYIGLTKASIVMSDDYSFELRPQTNTKKVVEKVKTLNLVILTEMAKARANNYIRDALQTSRTNLFGATLITWKNPKELGDADNISCSPIELKNINPKNLRWDTNYTRIEDMSYVYVLSKTTWFEIIDHPVLGQKKDLLAYIQKQVKPGREAGGVALDLDTQAQTENNIHKTDQGYNSGIDDTLILKAKFWLKNKGRANQKCMVSYFIGEDILLATQDANCKILPVAMVYEEKQAGDFYGSCAVHRLAPRIENYNNILKRVYGDVSGKGAPIYFINKDANIDFKALQEDIQTLPVVFVKSDGYPTQNIMKVDPNLADTSILNFLQNEKEDILSMAGIGRLTSEGDSGSLRSDRGVSSVQEQARVMDEASYTYIRNYIARVYTIAMEYVIKKYDTLDTSQKIRIDSQDPTTYETDGSNYKFITISKGGFTDLYYKADIIPDFSINPHVNKSAIKNLVLDILAIDRQAPNPEAQILGNKPELVTHLLWPYMKTPALRAIFARYSLDNIAQVMSAVGKAGMEQAMNNPNADVNDIYQNLAPAARKGLAGDLDAEIPDADDEDASSLLQSGLPGLETEI